MKIGLMTGALALAVECGSGEGHFHLTTGPSAALMVANDVNQCSPCSCPAAASDACKTSVPPLDSSLGNTWICGETTTLTSCQVLIQRNPWENCYDSSNGLFESCLTSADQYFCEFVMDGPDAKSGINCDDPHHNLRYKHYYSGTTPAACDRNIWLCQDCPSVSGVAEERDLSDRTKCCLPNLTAACAGHAGQTIPNDGCGYSALCPGTPPPPACNCPNGCCDPATGACQAGTIDSACGKGSVTCTNCTTSGLVCTSQVCAAASGGGGGCTGCLDGDTCVAGTTNALCGQGGLPCDTCVPPDTSCTTVNHHRGCF